MKKIALGFAVFTFLHPCMLHANDITPEQAAAIMAVSAEAGANIGALCGLETAYRLTQNKRMSYEQGFQEARDCIARRLAEYGWDLAGTTEQVEKAMTAAEGGKE